MKRITFLLQFIFISAALFAQDYLDILGYVKIDARVGGEDFF